MQSRRICGARTAVTHLRSRRLSPIGTIPRLVYFHRNGLAGSSTANAAASTAFVNRLSAAIGLVKLNDAAKLVHVAPDQRCTDAMAHIPSGFVGSEAKLTLNLQSSDAFLARHHPPHDPKPILQRLVRVLKDRAYDVREAIAARRTFVALPMMTARQGVNLRIAAARATHAVWPAPRDQIRNASFLAGKGHLELGNRHLLHRFGGHDDPPVRPATLYVGGFGTPERVRAEPYERKLDKCFWNCSYSLFGIIFRDRNRERKTPPSLRQCSCSLRTCQTSIFGRTKFPEASVARMSSQ